MKEGTALSGHFSHLLSCFNWSV